jgi:hypothetical protein
MARTLIPVYPSLRAGTDMSTTGTNMIAGALQQYFVNTEHEMLIVTTGATPVNLTIEVPVKVDGKSVTVAAIPIPASVTRVFGPFPKNIYSDPNTDGNLWIDFDVVTNLKVGVLQLGPTA